MIGFKEGLYFGILVTLIGVITICAFLPGTTLLAVIQAGGSVAVAASAVIAYHLYQSTVRKSSEERRKDISQGFLNESKVMLERICRETFFGDSDRVQWLSGARMILRYRSMKSRVTEPEHLEILNEHEEFWRLQLYTRLQDNKDQFTEEFFLPKEGRRNYPGIDPTSVVVIFDFARWRDGVPDPLREVDGAELFRKRAVAIDFHGVVDFLGKHYREKNKQQKG